MRLGIIRSLAFFMGFACLTSNNSLLAQHITPAPLPPIYSTAWADQNQAATQKQSTANSEKEEDGLGFLDQSMQQLSQTRVNAPSMNLEVTSVTKQASTVGKSPAAIFVITPEMIRRSGATCLPEVLRIAPGVCVSRYSSHGWAISIRGPHVHYSRELLMLIDGRKVYNTIHAGIYWDTQDMVLEDIERIEVIRGPGSTLWGANAVTGVINVITKNAKDTQDSLITAGGGNLDLSISQVRAGGSNGKGLAWRVYGKHFERGNEYLATGAHDNWRMGRGGFRLDWEPGRNDDRSLTVLGNFYGGEEGNQWNLTTPVAPYVQSFIGYDPVAGANVLARWNRRFSETSDYTFQTYFDRVYRNEYPLGHMQTTFDADFQHRFAVGERHNFVWGLESRQTHTDILRESFDVYMDRNEDTFQVFSGFVQDEISMIDDVLTFSLGTKLEHNSYTGFEFQPSARLLWTIDSRRVAWGAITRAVRLPSFSERYGHANIGMVPPPPLPMFFQLVGDEQVEAENMIAYELGYRSQTSDRFAWDVSTYINAYENIIGSTDGMPIFGPGYIIMPTMIGNQGRGLGYGMELTGQWTVNDAWRISGWYSVSILDFEAQPGSNPYIVIGTGQSVPHNQVQFRSQWDLGNHWELDAALRYMDAMVSPSVPSYITMDLRLGWRPSKNVEVALVGQNLLDDHHPEYANSPLCPVVTEVRRTVYAQMSWQW